MEGEDGGAEGVGWDGLEYWEWEGRGDGEGGVEVGVCGSVEGCDVQEEVAGGDGAEGGEGEFEAGGGGEGWLAGVVGLGVGSPICEADGD